MAVGRLSKVTSSGLPSLEGRLGETPSDAIERSTSVTSLKKFFRLLSDVSLDHLSEGGESDSDAASVASSRSSIGRSPAPKWKPTGLARPQNDLPPLKHLPDHARDVANILLMLKSDAAELLQGADAMDPAVAWHSCNILASFSIFRTRLAVHFEVLEVIIYPWLARRAAVPPQLHSTHSELLRLCQQCEDALAAAIRMAAPASGSSGGSAGATPDAGPVVADPSGTPVGGAGAVVSPSLRSCAADARTLIRGLCTALGDALREEGHTVITNLDAHFTAREYEVEVRPRFWRRWLEALALSMAQQRAAVAPPSVSALATGRVPSHGSRGAHSPPHAGSARGAADRSAVLAGAASSVPLEGGAQSLTSALLAAGVPADAGIAPTAGPAREGRARSRGFSAASFGLCMGAGALAAGVPGAHADVAAATAAANAGSAVSSATLAPDASLNTARSASTGSAGPGTSRLPTSRSNPHSPSHAGQQALASTDSHASMPPAQLPSPAQPLEPRAADFVEALASLLSWLNHQYGSHSDDAAFVTNSVLSAVCPEASTAPGSSVGGATGTSGAVSRSAAAGEISGIAGRARAASDSAAVGGGAAAPELTPPSLVELPRSVILSRYASEWRINWHVHFRTPLRRVLAAVFAEGFGEDAAPSV